MSRKSKHNIVPQLLCIPNPQCWIKNNIVTCRILAGVFALGGGKRGNERRGADSISPFDAREGIYTDRQKSLQLIFMDCYTS